MFRRTCTGTPASAIQVSPVCQERSLRYTQLELATDACMQLDASVELIRNFSPEQFARALESWSWIGIGDKTPVFTSPFGDVFFRSMDGFWWLDTLEATLTRQWANADELRAALNTPEGQDRFFLAGLAASAERRGVTLTVAQVYGFKIAPVVGGEIGVRNVETIDFVVSLNILGQLHEQVRDLPPGTPISGFIVANCDTQS
jgi:hypothetical protein